MPSDPSRRTFLFAASAAIAATGLPRALSASSASAPAAPAAPEWPTQPAALAREMVGASHARLERVRELLAERPALARASWDWGFGDWETALGAASHVGNREIAQLLIANGAPPTLFSAAMLGELEVVKALVAANPAVVRIPGPHSLTLLHHARAGGEAAKPVVELLEKIDGADDAPAVVPLAEAEQAALVGRYRFAPGEAGVIAIATNRFGLTFERAGASVLRLFHLGELTFHPSGVAGARVRFEHAAARAGTPARIVALTVHDPGLVLRAMRENPA